MEYWEYVFLLFCSWRFLSFFLEILGLNPGSIISCSLYVDKSLDLFLSQFENYLVWWLYHLIYVNNIELCLHFANLNNYYLLFLIKHKSTCFSKHIFVPIWII